MQRVMIVGGPGTGKSTLARGLGAATGLPVHHMDRIHWLPGWVERDKVEKIRMARTIEETDAWIFEGSLSSTFPTRAARADTLIWLDLPVGLRLWRVTKRLIMTKGTRPDLTEGCPERLSWDWLVFLKWIWDTRNSRRVQIRSLIVQNTHLKVHHLKTRADVRIFQETLK